MPPFRVGDVDASEDTSGRRSSRNIDLDEVAWASPSSHEGQDRDHDHVLVSHRSRRSAGSSKENIVISKNGRKSKLRNPRSQSLAKPISLKGIQLRPTVVFDTFWRFAAERKVVDDRRRAGLRQPWTDDPIIQKFHFCNTFRVLDKVSQYIIREVIEKGSQDPQELVFRITLFNLFTKIETWELLIRELGPLTWLRFNRNSYQRVLNRAKKEGVTLYTGAFQKPAPHFGYSDAYMNHLYLLEILMESDLTGRLLNAEYMAEVYEYLISFPSMGAFSTYQLMLNLTYSDVLNFSNMDFVVPGPGASSGLSKMFGDSLKGAKAAVPGIEEDIIRWLAKHQNAHFKRLGLKFSGLGPDRLPMALADIEHLLCEVDKYSRMAHPKLKGKRTELRGMFNPSPKIYPAKPTLPKAWSHPARAEVRIRPGGPPVVEKRYTVNRIGAHRDSEDGVEYKVYWLGYPDSEATWEPEKSLKADAPVAVEEYWAEKR
ncbi:hypothetical protein L208DRAFT_1391644 [Tricholoma matsutake]|nr:hypothetical protein L208DRAFT_1391644 [Tricholoma matsutake 945]